MGREERGDKFVWNEFGPPQAGPEHQRGVSIMDDANNPAVRVRDRRDAPLRGCSRPTHVIADFLRKDAMPRSGSAQAESHIRQV